MNFSADYGSHAAILRFLVILSAAKDDKKAKDDSMGTMVRKLHQG